MHFLQNCFEIADMILVGDSLNMSFAGREDTLSATLEQMIYHTNAVCTGAQKICNHRHAFWNLYK